MTTSLPQPSRMRITIAVTMALATLLVAAVVAVAATAFTAWAAGPAEPQVGVARVGDEVVVIVTEDDPAAEARSATLQWSLLALSLSVIPAMAVGWIVAGRLLRRVDTALADVDTAQRDRDRRLQDVVHELRTPLAVMGTNLELAATGPSVDPESAGFIDAARRALDRMDRTVDDLAGSGELVVEPSRDAVDLGDVATDVVGEFSGPARQRALHLVTGSSGTVEAGSAEPQPLRTVVGNLVANAVRLAPRGSVVTVDWGTWGDWAWMSVQDEGPGIPERHHGRVFERGWRGPHDRHRDSDGSGIGLTIARQLTEAQGGTLTIDSTEGSGTTFTVWLPRTADADVREVVADDGIHPRKRAVATAEL